MQVSLNNQLFLSGLFASSSTDITTLAVSARNPLSTAAVAAATNPPVPPPPWNATETATQAGANVQSALAGHNIIGTATALSTAQPGTGNAALDAKTMGFDQDYQKLFNLYQGLSTLMDVATQSQVKSLTPIDQLQLSKAFTAGLGQVSDFVNSTKFNNLRLATGTDSSSQSSTLKISSGSSSYATPALANSMTDDVPALDGTVQFNIAVQRAGSTINVPIDLSGLGSQPRSLANVINYVNAQLKAAGIDSRFASNRFPGQAQTVTVNGQPVTISPAQDQFGFQVNVSAGETVSFSAPQTAGAIYLGQTVGDPNPDHDPTTNDGHTQAQLLKFQTDTTSVSAPPQIAGQPNFVPGRVFADNLDPNVLGVRATQVGADGSVYLLADVKGTVNGQSIQGSQDVALMKYDSAGHLIYTRTLGSSSTASGLSLAVSADGKVAVSGSVTGDMLGTTDGALNSGGTGSAFSDSSDSFVTLYDDQGQEVWTERRGARLNDEANQVTFGSDGTVYVAGRAEGQMPGPDAPIGGYDGYVEAFKTDSNGVPSAAFTSTFGTTGADKPQGLVVSGNNLITASVENGHAVLRSFDNTTGALVATRNLGDLQGGSIAGLSLNGGQIVVAGTTSNGALSAGSVTRAASGGSDAFVAQLSADLSSQPSDAIAYYGGTGDDRATSVAVSGGQVFIAGVAGTDLPNQPAVGKQDGFLASIDVASGNVTWSSRFTGQDGIAAPATIAAAPTGASVLDRLGLPTGTISTTQSQELETQSSLRPGTQFTIGAAGSPLKTVTIDPGETWDTLVQKINRASGFQATASVFHNLDGTTQLKIVPTYGSITVQLGAGPLGKDALPILGLNEGDINLTKSSSTGQTVPADGGSKIYGLGLSANLNLNNASQITHALAQVSAAMSVVRTAYQDLVKLESPTSSNPGKTGGTVPTYLSNQLANLQAGLARLTGGSSSSTSLLA